MFEGGEFIYLNGKTIFGKTIFDVCWCLEKWCVNFMVIQIMLLGKWYMEKEMVMGWLIHSTIHYYLVRMVLNLEKEPDMIIRIYRGLRGTGSVHLINAFSGTINWTIKRSGVNNNYLGWTYYMLGLIQYGHLHWLFLYCLSTTGSYSIFFCFW